MWRQMVRPVLFICLLAGLLYGGVCPFSAADAADSSRAAQLQKEIDRALKKDKKGEAADAMYKLAKLKFDSGDLRSAMVLMGQSLELEKLMNRPEKRVGTGLAYGHILAVAGKRAEAFRVYEEALLVARKENLASVELSIENSLGRLYIEAGRPDDAERVLTEARELARSTDDHKAEANALINLSVVASKKGQDQAAGDYLDEAVVLLSEGEAPGLLGSVLMERARSNADRGRLESSLKDYKEAIKLHEAELNDEPKAVALFHMGKVLRRLRKPDQARHALTESKKIFFAIKKPDYMIENLIELGGAEAEAGNFDLAAALEKDALKLAVATGDRKKQRDTLVEMGYAHMLQGSPEPALNQFIKALNLCEDGDAERQASILTDIAMCYKALGQSGASVRHYQKAIALLSAAGDRAGRASALNSLAVVYLDMGRPAAFKEYSQKALKLYKTLDDAQGMAVLNYNLGQLELVQGYPAEAIPLYQEALKAMSTTDDALGKGRILRGLGLAYLGLGRAGKALEQYQQSLPLAEESNNIEALWDTYLGMGKCLKRLNRKGEAINHLKKAVELAEAERSQLTRDSFKTFNMDLRQDCFQELVELLASSGDHAGALEVAEKGRARAFLDLLEGRHSSKIKRNKTAALTASRPSLAELKNSAVPEPGSRGVKVTPRPSYTVEASTISPVNALPPSIEEIRELVKNGGAPVVEYFALPDKVLIWVVYPDGRIKMPPPVAIDINDLRAKVGATYESIIAMPKKPGELTAVGLVRETNLKELYSLLVEPVASYLPTDSDKIVTIVPHGPLFSVPFAALISPAGKYLVEEHVLNFTPAIGVLRATQKLDKKVRDEENRLLAFGNPITKAISFLGSLPYSAKEAKKVAALFGPERSVVKIGKEASKTNFKKLAPGSTVIHLATHGLINEQKPMQSALVLAPDASDDGLLTVRDILNLPPLKEKLVILSACQTGRGKITGDGVVGLSRSFVIAGTPSIVVSLWNVDDVMTEYQMVSFYKDYLDGKGKALALRDAQLKTINLMEKMGDQTLVDTPGTVRIRANPRYWAAFQLIGESI